MRGLGGAERLCVHGRVTSFGSVASQGEFPVSVQP